MILLVLVFINIVKRELFFLVINFNIFWVIVFCCFGERIVWKIFLGILDWIILIKVGVEYNIFFILDKILLVFLIKGLVIFGNLLKNVEGFSL